MNSPEPTFARPCLGIRETASFVLRHAGDPPASLLDVGGGNGDLAELLERAGFKVTVVDAAADAIAEARGRGLNASHAQWPDYEGPSCDHILFTRSLHHIDNVSAAVDHAASLTPAQGLIIVEDFAFHDADEATIRWFRDTALDLIDVGALREDTTDFVWRMALAEDPLRVWHTGSCHIHPAAAQRSALSAAGAIIHEEAVPYLYRYLERVLIPEGVSAEQLLEIERSAGANGDIQLIGRRWVVRSNATGP